jgi:hypothetical protein
VTVSLGLSRVSDQAAIPAGPGAAQVLMRLLIQVQLEVGGGGGGGRPLSAVVDGRRSVGAMIGPRATNCRATGTQRESALTSKDSPAGGLTRNGRAARPSPVKF